jgi:hypothetical protein
MRVSTVAQSAPSESRRKRFRTFIFRASGETAAIAMSTRNGSRSRSSFRYVRTSSTTTGPSLRRYSSAIGQPPASRKRRRVSSATPRYAAFRMCWLKSMSAQRARYSST